MISHENAELSMEVKQMNTYAFNNPDANGILEIIRQFFQAIQAILEALGIIKKPEGGEEGGEADNK